MSLDSFTTETDDGEPDTSATPENEPEEEEVKSDGGNEHDERFFGEDMPNEPPSEEVEEREIVDIEAIEGKELAMKVASSWEFRHPEDYSLTMKLHFNDGATWHWPFKGIDGNPNSHLSSFLDRWLSELLGKDLELKEFEDYVDWDSLIGQTEWEEPERKKFNSEKSWAPHIGKKVKSEYNDVEVEVEDDNAWMDDW